MVENFKYKDSKNISITFIQDKVRFDFDNNTYGFLTQVNHLKKKDLTIQFSQENLGVLLKILFNMSVGEALLISNPKIRNRMDWFKKNK